MLCSPAVTSHECLSVSAPLAVGGVCVLTAGGDLVRCSALCVQVDPAYSFASMLARMCAQTVQGASKPSTSTARPVAGPGGADGVYQALHIYPTIHDQGLVVLSAVLVFLSCRPERHIVRGL